MKAGKPLYLIGLLLLFYYPIIICPQELPLMISVCAYNASDWVEKNLDSIFGQQYDNFNVVYVDDASSDDTVAKVQQYINAHNLQDKITLIVNPVRQRKMKNIYTIFHDCPDETIIVQVDGDDWLAHDQVFAMVNRTYTEQDVWLTYGQFQVYPSNELGYCRPVPDAIKENRDYREYRFVYTHLRTYYAWLIKSIKLQDFIAEEVPGYNGKFFPIANDNATYFPMLEMCGPHYAFIPDILYIHNHSNPHYGRNVEFELSVYARKDIRSRPKYPVLKQPIINRLEAFDDAKADIVILSDSNPEGLEKLLFSLSDHAIGIQAITVIYEASNQKIAASYKAMHYIFPHISWIPAKNKYPRTLLCDVIKASTQNHVVIALDKVYLTKPLNITECIRELERTFAHGFYFNFAQNKKPFYYSYIQKEIIPSQAIYKDLCAWKFNCGNYALYNNIDMTLFRKDDLIARIETVPYTDERSLAAFLDSWQTHRTIDGHMVGLFYKESKLAGKRTSMLTHAIEKPLQLAQQFVMVYKQRFEHLITLKTYEPFLEVFWHYHKSNT